MADADIGEGEEIELKELEEAEAEDDEGTEGTEGDEETNLDDDNENLEWDDDRILVPQGFNPDLGDFHRLGRLSSDERKINHSVLRHLRNNNLVRIRSAKQNFEPRVVVVF